MTNTERMSAAKRFSVEWFICHNTRMKDVQSTWLLPNITPLSILT